MPPSARTSILMSLRWTLRRAKPIQIIAVIMTAAPKSLCSNDSAEEYRRLLNTPRLKTLIKFSVCLANSTASPTLSARPYSDRDG